MYSYTIKDLENLSGIKAHTIRIWEQRYSFLKPERTDTNIRFYSGEELKKLLNVALLNKYGFKISHIDKMDEVEVKEKILSLNQVQAQQDRIVNELIQYMVDLDVEKFETVLDNYILPQGFDKAIPQIIFPYLEKIGILWLTNHINPAQEHLVTNIIRQKLVVGINNTICPIKINTKILLFLPEGEYHELGLLFMHYLLKCRGINVIYLGCSIPINDVAYVVRAKNPDYLYCHLTTNVHKFNFEKFLADLSNQFPDMPVIVSGQLTAGYLKKLNPPIIFKRSLAESMEFVNNL